MFARDYWKLTRLLLVCVVILGTSCDGNSTGKDLQDTTPTLLQHEEMESETEVGSGVAGTDSNAKFSVQNGGGNLVSQPRASSGNETVTVGMVSSSPPPLISGKEQENGAIRQLVTTPSAEGVPDNRSDSLAPIMDSSLHTREFKGTEASIEDETPLPSQGGLDTSTLLPQSDENSISEFDDSEFVTLRKTNDATYPTVVSNSSLDTEMATLQTTDQQQSSSSRILHSTEAYLHDISVESTDSGTFPFESSHTTVQDSLYTTRNLVDLVTTTVAVSLSTTPIRDQLTKQNKSTTHTNESHSLESAQTQGINPNKPVMTLGQSILIAVGIVVIILAILGTAAICFIRRKNQSKVVLSSDNEKFFISRNQEEEPLSDSFVEKNKSSTVGMYSDVELEIIKPSEMQEIVLNNVVHDGEDTKTPKCLETTTKIRDISD